MICPTLPTASRFLLRGRRRRDVDFFVRPWHHFEAFSPEIRRRGSSTCVPGIACGVACFVACGDLGWKKGLNGVDAVGLRGGCAVEFGQSGVGERRVGLGDLIGGQWSGGGVVGRGVEGFGAAGVLEGGGADAGVCSSNK